MDHYGVFWRERYANLRTLLKEIVGRHYFLRGAGGGAERAFLLFREGRRCRQCRLRLASRHGGDFCAFARRRWHAGADRPFRFRGADQSTFRGDARVCGGSCRQPGRARTVHARDADLSGARIRMGCDGPGARRVRQDAARLISGRSCCRKSLAGGLAQGSAR